MTAICMWLNKTRCFDNMQEHSEEKLLVGDYEIAQDIQIDISEDELMPREYL